MTKDINYITFVDVKILKKGHYSIQLKAKFGKNKIKGICKAKNSEMTLISYRNFNQKESLSQTNSHFFSHIFELCKRNLTVSIYFF